MFCNLDKHWAEKLQYFVHVNEFYIHLHLYIISLLLDINIYIYLVDHI